MIALYNQIVVRSRDWQRQSSVLSEKKIKAALLEIWELAKIMKIKTLALILSGFASTMILASNPPQEIGDVSDSESLTELFSVMGDIAADGPSLSHFSWDESNQPPRQDAKCYPVGQHDASQYVIDIIDSMDWATAEQRSKIDAVLGKAIEDFSTILGVGELNRCDWDISEQMTLTRVTQFHSLKSDYKITFNLGFED